MNEEHVVHRDAEVTQLFAQAAQPSDASRFAEQFEFALLRARRRRKFAFVLTAAVLLVAALLAAPWIASVTLAFASLIVDGSVSVVEQLVIVASICVVMAPTVWFVMARPWLK